MNILELAKQAGFVEYELDDGTTEAFDKRYAIFAALVAAQEREACANLCETMDSISDYYGLRVELACADAIRARGTT